MMRILVFERKVISSRSRYEATVQHVPGELFDLSQVFKGKLLLWLAYQSIGVIYGDIGTSPLYVYSSSFSSAPSYDDLVGVLSLILWSLFMMVTVKYILIVLHADNDGEGGTFSTYSLLSRYVRLTLSPTFFGIQH
jgi:KUP system potassium uptake protein